MEIHIYIVQAKSQADHMSQTYNDNIDRPKPQDVRVGILKIYLFCWKFQQRNLGPRGALLELHSICLREIIQKLQLVRRKMLLDHSSHIVKVCVKAMC